MINVVIVDDHAMIRDGLSQPFHGDSGVEVVGSGGSIAKLGGSADGVDVVLLDVRLEAGKVPVPIVSIALHTSNSHSALVITHTQPAMITW